MPQLQKMQIKGHVHKDVVSISETILDGQLTLHSFNCRTSKDSLSMPSLQAKQVNDNKLNLGLNPDQLLSNSQKLKIVIPENAVLTKGNDQAVQIIAETNEKHQSTKSKVKTTAPQAFDADESERFYGLGLHFYRKFKDGTKYFLFSNLGDVNAQKRSILGISTFINYFESLKIAIVTNNFENSVYSKGQDNAKIRKEVTDVSPILSCDVVDQNGIHFIEIDDLSSMLNANIVKGKEYYLKEFLKEYDVVLYDFSKVDNKKQNPEIYFLFFRLAQDVTLSLTLKKNTFSEIEKMSQYFQQYNIKFNGCIVAGTFKG